MREILFRAKREDNGEWVYGYYVHLPDAAGSVHIMHVRAQNPDENNNVHYVIPETVGEFTGMTNEDGTRIFEGDIVENIETGMRALVQYFPEHAAFMLWCRSETVNQIEYAGEISFFEIQVIGNIHDNPELIGDKDT